MSANQLYVYVNFLFVSLRHLCLFRTNMININNYWGFPCGSVVKNLPAVQEPQEMRVRSLGGEDALE